LDQGLLALTDVANIMIYFPYCLFKLRPTDVGKGFRTRFGVVFRSACQSHQNADWDPG